MMWGECLKLVIVWSTFSILQSFAYFHVKPPINREYLLQINKISYRSPLKVYSINKSGKLPSGVELEDVVQWEKEEREYQAKHAIMGDDDEAEHDVPVDREINSEIPPLPDYIMKYYRKEMNDAGDTDGETMVASKLPTIAIIGRPNTGKSTLVNRLANSYRDGSIVHDEPGITRDRTYKLASWSGYYFQVVDTGGIVFNDKTDAFSERIMEQALIALKESNAAILVCDGQAGITNYDRMLADYLRKKNKVPLYLAVNKCESDTKGHLIAQDFWALGLCEPYPVSAIHGTGLNELFEVICTKHLPKVTKVIKENITNVAIIGRPNVGKSSMLNRLYGGNRSIVSDIAGTTRDSVDAHISRGDKLYRFVDTAGIRRKGKVEYGTEYFMVDRAFKAIKRSEVVLFVIDAIQGIVDQDRILADRIAKEGRGCIIILNKWDAVQEKDEKTYIMAMENIRTQLPILRWANIVLTSAKTGQRTEKIFDYINQAAEQFSRRISTSVINEVVQDAVQYMPPPAIGAKSGRLYYSIQVSTSPPAIVHFVNDPSAFTDNYVRYLERKIRESLKFEGTPIRMQFRGKSLRDISRASKVGVNNQAKYESRLYRG